MEWQRTLGGRTLIAAIAMVLIAMFALAGAGCTSSKRAYRAAAISFAATKALDVHSTAIAIRAGAREGNPFLPDAWYWQAPIAAAGTYGVLKMSKRIAAMNQPLATAILTAAATAYALIAAHNYQLARRMSR